MREDRGVRRIPIVGVMGSGADAHEERSEPLGRWLAREGVHLLTGGGGGVMAAVTRAFVETPDRRGCAIGVLVGSERGRPDPASGYPNPYVEIPIYTHLPLSGAQGESAMSRNHINALTSDVLVALAGAEGTASEVRLALRYGRPVFAFVEKPTDIPRLPEEVPVRTEWDGLVSSLRDALRRIVPSP